MPAKKPKPRPQPVEAPPPVQGRVSTISIREALAASVGASNALRQFRVRLEMVASMPCVRGATGGELIVFEQHQRDYLMDAWRTLLMYLEEHE